MTHAVIFDVDGTLLNSSTVDEKIYMEAVAQVLGNVKFRPDLIDYNHVTDTGILLQVFEDNNILASDEVIARIKEEFFALIENFVATKGPFREMPGARNLLKRLRNSVSHDVAIATGGWQQSARFKLDTAGFDLGGIPLASSDDAIDRAGIMQVALDSIGENCRSVTYFGDALWDQRACNELGWNFQPVGPGLNGLSSFEQEFMS
jgi:beta-phosphoglucomutase-like phosphatase (HAD superfamily)